MNRNVAGQWWELELVDGWDAEVDEHCVSIIHPEGCGALQISAARKKDGTAVTREELLKHAAKDEELRSHLAEQTWGDFRGFQIVYAEDDTFWRRWWLANGEILVFVTYNCPHAHMDDELESVNEMVGTLKVKRGD